MAGTEAWSVLVELDFEVRISHNNDNDGRYYRKFTNYLMSEDRFRLPRLLTRDTNRELDSLNRRFEIGGFDISWLHC